VSEKPGNPASLLARTVGRLGLFATYLAAALFLLVIAGDLAVLVRHLPMVGWVALLVGAGPLVALLLSTLASYVNYYGVWRVLRGKDEYDAGQDLKSHAADVPQAAQALLAGRSGCLPVASAGLLVLSLVLLLATSLPAQTPFVGALAVWNVHQGGQAPSAAPGLAASTTPSVTSVPTVLPTAAPSPTPTPVPVVVKFSIAPTSAFWNCTSQGAPAGAQTITLDNSASNIAVTWSATAIERDGAGNPWAVFSPGSGQVPAYAKQSVTISPDPRSSICVPSEQVAWHANIVVDGAGTYTFTYTTSWILT
jgi:hypothetical protein